MFCVSCGNNLNLDLITDPSCPPSNQCDRVVYVMPQKSAGTGIVLSFLFAGLGHLYAEQIGKGLLFMIIYFALMFFMIILAIYGLFMIVGGVLVLAFWVWAMYDVNKIIKDYNEHIRLTGRPPV